MALPFLPEADILDVPLMFQRLSDSGNLLTTQLTPGLLASPSTCCLLERTTTSRGGTTALTEGQSTVSTCLSTCQVSGAAAPGSQARIDPDTTSV